MDNPAPSTEIQPTAAGLYVVVVIEMRVIGIPTSLAEAKENAKWHGGQVYKLVAES